MNTTMADGAEQRLDAQIAEALFGQPGMSKMDVANRVRELRGDGPALLVQREMGQADALLREVCAQLESLDCGACIGSHAPMEGLHGRIARHLSAQPSPGGQDALAALPLYRLADDANGSRGMHRDETGSWVKLQDVERALAARQPVAQEPVAPKKMARAVALDLMHAVYEHHGWKRAEGESMTARVNSLYDVTLEAGRNRFVATPKPAAPPAQAVHLGDFKALYRAYVRLLEAGRDRIRDLGGTCDPVDVMEANDVGLQAARRVLDSQAVGNG